MKIFSVDAETNGLYGIPFAIGAVVREDGQEVARFEARCPIEGQPTLWVAEHVLPALEGMAETHENLEQLLEAFWAFWLAHRDGATCIAHCGSPVESHLFRRCVESDVAARQWSGPFPLHEVASVLLLRGENPTSVDDYVRKHALDVPFEGVSHHPLYDAIVAAVVWEHPSV